MDEVISFEQQVFISGSGQGVGETVTEVELRGMAAPAPKIPVRLTGDQRLFVCDRLTGKARAGNQVAPKPGCNRVTPAIDKNASQPGR